MTTVPPGGNAPQDDDADMGLPIDELRDLSLSVDGRFGRRVRGRIERRVLAGELLGLAWSAPVMVLFELLRAPFELFGSNRRT